MDKPEFGPRHFYFRNQTPNHNLKTIILVIPSRNIKFLNSKHLMRGSFSKFQKNYSKVAWDTDKK